MINRKANQQFSHYLHLSLNFFPAVGVFHLYPFSRNCLEFWAKTAATDITVRTPNIKHQTPNIKQKVTMFIPEKPTLKIGRTYFMCSYYLRDIPVPEIETCIYIGENIFDFDKDEKEIYHYFEHPEKYYSKQIEEEYNKFQEEPETNEEELAPIRVSDSDLEALIYDYNNLCKWVDSLKSEPNAEKIF